MTNYPPTFHALCEALDDEYKARAAYLAVIDKLGPVQPFLHIVQSEQRHIEALLRQFDRFGWAAPVDRWRDSAEAPDSLKEACQVGVQAEIDNVALYDRLFAMAGDEQVLAVFRNLRHASQACHLPAFQRFLEGGNAAVCGPEGGHHHGRGTCCGGHGHHHGQGGCAG